MKRLLLYSCAVLISVLLFYSCASIDRDAGRVERAEGGEKRAPLAPRSEREFSEIRSTYDLESLLLPVLQYNNLSLSFDFFPQFAWDENDVFPRYLYRAFKLEQSPFRPGEGTVLTAGYEGLDAELRMERALLSREEEGDWWKIRHTYFDETILYEVFVSPDGEPVRIRFIDPETNLPRDVEPAPVAEYDVESESGEAHDAAPGTTQLRARDYEKEWSYAFSRPYIVGEELVDTSAGRFMSVHVKDVLDDEYNTGADYYISPDVPGNIVRIRYSSPGQRSYTISLETLTVGNISTVDGTDVVNGRREGARSEGSPMQPRMVDVGQLSEGWLAPGGTSFYRVAASRRADIYMSVQVTGGDAELRFYGPDPTFNNVRSRSEGRELFAEEYFVESGTDLFFAVVNTSAHEGRELTISVTEDVFLSPVGIAMRGEIFRSATELKSGRSHEESMNLNGLNYYMTRVSRGRNLRITASDLPDSVELVWLEAREGYYSGVYTFRDRELSSIEITDIAPGTECYFYVVADLSMASLGSVFTLTVEEYMR